MLTPNWQIAEKKNNPLRESFSFCNILRRKIKREKATVIVGLFTSLSKTTAEKKQMVVRYVEVFVWEKSWVSDTILVIYIVAHYFRKVFQ